MAKLLETLRAGEDAHTEFKTSLADWRKIVETVAAMATVGGGQILVGVRPDGAPCGVSLPEGAQERLIQRILSATDPRVFVQLDRPRVGEVALLRIRVPPGDGPHLAFGRAFHRPGPATVQMTRDEYERRLLDRLRESSGWERRPAEGCTLADVDGAEIATFVERAVLPDAEPADVLRRLKLWSDDLPAVGAILLFGREPQSAYPQATVRGRVARGALGDLAEDVLAAEGPLFDQVEEAVRFVLRNLRRRATLEGTRRVEAPELPAVAVREVLLNAVVHRDYRSTAPTQVRLDDDALVVWNPGHLPAPLTPALLRQEHPSVPGNPLIARAFHRAGYIEQWGTGTLRVIEAMAAAGNPEPTFAEEHGGVRVALPLPGGVGDDLSVRQAAWLAEHPPGAVFKTAAYAAAFGVTPRTALSDLQGLAVLGLVEARGRGPASHWLRR